jgi:hypothetical protein
MPLFKRKPDQSSEDRELLTTIRKNVEDWYAYFSENIEKYRDNLLFVNAEDEQWTKSDKEDYDRRKKVRITLNQINTYIQSLKGDFRENTPALQTRPVDNTLEVDQKLLDINEGWLRTKIDGEESKVAFQTAYENALYGFGAIEAYTEYESDKSFDQIVRITSPKNPIKAFFDPRATDCAKSDGEYSGIHQTISKEQFEEKYPGFEFPQDFSNSLSNLQYFSWGNDKVTTIIKYAYKKRFITVLVELRDGVNSTFVKREEVDDAIKKHNKMRKRIQLQNQAMQENAQFTLFGQPPQLLPVPEPLKKIRERKVEDFKIVIVHASYKDILTKETVWPSKILPVLYVDGSSFINPYTGKQTIKPFTQFAKDPQRAINYSVSENMNAMKNSLYGKVQATAGQLQGLMQFYKDNTSIALPYKPEPGVEAPKILPPTPISPIFMQTFDAVSKNLQFIIGMHPSIIGAQGLERSGVALGHEIRQANKANFETIDNVYRAMEKIGNMLLEIFPTLFDTTRTITLTSSDGSTSTETINKPAGFNEDGIQTFENEIQKQQFKVKIRPGAPFALQKKEQLDQLIKYVGIDPQAIPYFRDKIVSLFDLQNTPQMVKRAKFLVPPAVLQAEGEEIPQIPQNPAQIAEQQAQQMESQSKIMKAQADQTNAQANMIKARGQIVDTIHQSRVTDTRARTEMGKAALDFRSKAIETANDVEKQRLSAENEQLKNILRNITEIRGI